MSKKQYYEAHITMVTTEGAERLRRHLEENTFGVLPQWRFSAIDGDANLGDGVKCYLTRQMNMKIGQGDAQRHLLDIAKIVAASGVNVVRRKIELVLWDDRISDVPCTAEECAACPSQV